MSGKDAQCRITVGVLSRITVGVFSRITAGVFSMMHVRLLHSLLMSRDPCDDAKGGRLGGVNADC